MATDTARCGWRGPSSEFPDRVRAPPVIVEAMRSWVCGVTLVAACGGGVHAGDDATFTALRGAPVYVHNIGFDPNGALMAAGGERSSFPPNIHRQMGDAWQTDDIAPGVQFVPNTDAYVANRQAYRLADVSTFHWVGIGNPETDFIAAVSPRGRAFTKRSPPPPPPPAPPAPPLLHYFEAGDGDWTPIPGTEGALDTGPMLAEEAGGLVFAEQSGLYRFDGKAVSRMVDCATSDCGTPIGFNTAGDLFIYSCTTFALHRVAAGGTGSTRVAALPRENFAACPHPMGVTNDKLYMLASSLGPKVGDGTNTAIFRIDIAPGSSSVAFERVVGVEPNWSYRMKDDSTIYRYAKSPLVSGIGIATL